MVSEHGVVDGCIEQDGMSDHGPITLLEERNNIRNQVLGSGTASWVRTGAW